MTAPTTPLPPPPKLIGITGYAGTGKDTVRAELEAYFYYTGFAFADPILNMLIELANYAGMDFKFLNSRAFKELPIPGIDLSYRQLAQSLGTEWARGLRPDFWLRIADGYMQDAQAASHYPEFCQFVISDVRFVNEANYIRERGGVIWRVERAAAVPVRAHVSEQELYHIAPDAVIENNGTVQQLQQTIHTLMQSTYDCHPV